MTRATRLDAKAWVDAAYAAFGSEGLDGVRVEHLARALGVTKGSFYWHFTDRQDLVDAVLERWAHETELVIDEAARAPGGPAERLAALFAAVDRRAQPRMGETLLYAQADRPGVADALARVTERRIASVAALLEEFGHEPLEARARAVLALAAALGRQQLAHAVPSAAGGPAIQRRMFLAALDMVLGPGPSPGAASGPLSNAASGPPSGTASGPSSGAASGLDPVASDHTP